MAQSTARTISGGGAVDLDSYLWPATGTEPSTTADAAYEAYKEPVAGMDNNANYGMTWDLGALNYETGALKDHVDTLASDIDMLRSDLDSLESSFSSHKHDARYYRQAEADDTFVDTAGDTMTGALSIDRVDTRDGYLEAFGETSSYWQVVQDGFGRASHYWNVEPGTQNIITENEGASWVKMEGGSFTIDVYDGVTGDVGARPSWTRALAVTTDGVEFSEGGSLGADLAAQGNAITSLAKLALAPSSNDMLTITDGSGDSTNTPYTVTHNDRNLRIKSGLTGDATMRWDLYSNVYIPTGDLIMDQFQAHISLGGNSGGPHMIDFGDHNGGGLNLVYRTSPNRLNVEHPDGSQIWGTDQDTNAVDFSPTNYVVLPVRGSPPSNPPSGATWIET